MGCDFDFKLICFTTVLILFRKAKHSMNTPDQYTYMYIYTYYLLAFYIMVIKILFRIPVMFICSVPIFMVYKGLDFHSVQCVLPYKSLFRAFTNKLSSLYMHSH